MLKRPKPIYLIFLILPLTYLLLWKYQDHKYNENLKHDDYLSFSVKSSKQAIISLSDNGKSIISWNLISKGYKNIEFVGKANNTSEIEFKADSLKANDTISFLGINFYSHNKLYYLSDDIKQNITLKNAKLSENDGAPVFIVEKTGMPVIIKFNLSADDGKNSSSTHKKAIIIIIFLLAFFSVLAFNPTTRYFIFIVIIAEFALLFSYFAIIPSNGNVELLTSSKIKNAEIFYSRSPFFSNTKKYSSSTLTEDFTRPLNLETEKYLRFDLGDSLININQIKVKISSGIFFKSYNLAELPQERLLLNDLELSDGIYHITGNDPYIKFTSDNFVKNQEIIVFLEHNFFLFITIIVFMILISMCSLIDKFTVRLKLEPVYFIILLIPLVYQQINHHWIIKSVPQNSDYVYFSAKSSRPAFFTLMNGSDSLTTWIVDSPGFKYLQYKGKINFDENFSLRISNLSKSDTISFLSINLFHKNRTYSLYKTESDLCNVSNGVTFNKADGLNIAVKKSGVPVSVNLFPTNLLKEKNSGERNYPLIILMIFILFIVVIIFSPFEKYLITVSISVSIFMFVFFWISRDAQSQLHLSLDSKINRADFFYNYTPHFQPNRCYIDNVSKQLYKFQIYLSDFNFYRCDFGNNKDERLKNIQISERTGILRNNFDYNTISSNNILLNDLIKKGDEYIVCGNDPFLTLSSDYQVSKMLKIYSYRQDLFFLISVFLFIILIIVNKRLSKLNMMNLVLTGFFLSFIFSTLILHIFNSSNIILISEKRCTNQSPEFKKGITEEFIRDLNSYISDQIPGRKNIIRMNNLIQYLTFGQLYNNPIFHFGEDGWIFYVGGAAKENFENRKPLTQVELKKIKTVLEEREEWLKSRGIKFYMVFPPMSQTIYKEYIGPRMKQYYKQTKSEQLFEYLKNNSNLNIIDVYSPLMKIKNNNGLKQPYYKNNCHWNFIGGYAAYCSIIDYIKKDFPNIGEPLNEKDFSWELTDKYRPDLLQLMDVDVFYKFQQYIPKYKYNIITDTVYPFYPGLDSPAPPACVNTNRKSNPTMFMYGDSYAASIIEFLFRNFSKTYFIWTPLFHPDIIEKEKPDMVIQELVDASILNILLENKPLPKLKDSIKKN